MDERKLSALTAVRTTLRNRSGDAARTRCEGERGGFGVCCRGDGEMVGATRVMGRSFIG